MPDSPTINYTDLLDGEIRPDMEFSGTSEAMPRFGGTVNPGEQVHISVDGNEVPQITQYGPSDRPQAWDHISDELPNGDHDFEMWTTDRETGERSDSLKWTNRVNADDQDRAWQRHRNVQYRDSQERTDWIKKTAPPPEAGEEPANEEEKPERTATGGGGGGGGEPDASEETGDDGGRDKIEGGGKGVGAPVVAAPGGSNAMAGGQAGGPGGAGGGGPGGQPQTGQAVVVGFEKGNQAPPAPAAGGGDATTRSR